MKKIWSIFILSWMAVPLLAQDKPTTHPGHSSRSEIMDNIGKHMIYVQGGTFTMGCTRPQDSCYWWELPSHQVTLNNYFIGQYEVTQREWEAVMKTRPWFSKDCADCPVENISWYDAQVFINTLNQLTGKHYRLPTEAEWEYAARGGKNSKGFEYAGSNAVTSVAWDSTNSAQMTHPVGKKKPNELNLYDMSGNVWEWCSDWFDDHYYTKSPNKNPKGGDDGTFRVCRGGSWWGGASDQRVSNRDRYPADARDDDVGFRLAKD